MFTKSQFLAMQFDHTPWVADRLRESGEPYSLNAAFVQSQTRAPSGEPFTGQAGDAAQDKGDVIAAALNRFHAETDNAANVLRAAHEALWPAAWNLRTSINAASGPVIVKDGGRLSQLPVAFFVTEDWKVQADLSRFTGSLTADQNEALNAWLQGAQEGLDKNREALEQASDKAAADLKANVHFDQVATDGQIGSLVGETPAQAKADVQAYLAGTATPEQKARVEAATSLSDTQQQALKEGGDAKLSPEQTSVVSEMSSQLQDKSASDIKALVKDKLHGDGKAISNALELMSNPHVASAVPLVQGDKAGPWRGGMDKLPAKIQQTLRDPVITTEAHDTGYNTSIEHKYPTLGQLDDLADLVGASDEATRQGSALDKSMIGKVGEALAESHKDGGNAEIDSKINPTMQHILNTAGVDSQAFHDVATDKQHGQQFVGDLMKHNWSDDGEAAKNAVHAATQESEGTGAAATRSGETMRSFVDYMKDHSDELTHSRLPGSLPLPDSLGNRNHALDRELAEGFGKYLGAAYGDELPGHGTSGFGPPMATDDVTKVFQVLDTDHAAAEKMHAAAYAQSMAWTEKFAGSLNTNPGNPDLGALHHAGDLLGSVDKASETLGADVQKINGTAFDAAKPWASSLVKLLPGGDVLAKVLDSASSSLKDAYTGQGPQGHVLDTASLRYQIAASLIGSGKLPQNGELNGYLTADGHLRDPGSFTNDHDRDAYNDALTNYLSNQPAGHSITDGLTRAQEQYNARKK
ncbi:hypothetical protein [Segniliparus rotundus]|nr:hypothetical protein [Segniliparus rotundus]